MAFDSSRLPYICQNCLRHLHRRPQALQLPSSAFAKQCQARNLRTIENQILAEKEADELHAFKKLLEWKQMLNANVPLTMAERYKWFITYRVRNKEKLWEFHRQILQVEKGLTRKVGALKKSPVFSESDRIMAEEMENYRTTASEVWRFIHNPIPSTENDAVEVDAMEEERDKKRRKTIGKRNQILKKFRKVVMEETPETDISYNKKSAVIPPQPGPTTEILHNYDPFLPQDLDNFDMSAPIISDRSMKHHESIQPNKFIQQYEPAQRDRFDSQYEINRKHDLDKDDPLIREDEPMSEDDLMKHIELMQMNKIKQLRQLERKDEKNSPVQEDEPMSEDELIKLSEAEPRHSPIQQRHRDTHVMPKAFRRVGPAVSILPLRHIVPQPVRTPFSTMVKVSRTVGYSCYWETYAPTFIQKAQADTFFTQQAQAKFLTSVALFRHFPSSDLPEVAFIGRSNVGKSSLLNALVNAKGLARTSATRGFTKTMNLYGVAPKGNIHVGKTEDGYDNITGAGGLTIVDMPGYGEGSLAEWGVQIMKYLENRKQLRRVFVLIDAMHGIKEKDESILASLRLAAIPHQIILSKLDRIYIPASNSIKSRDGKALKRKGSEKGLDLVMATIREQIQPAHGFGALGELLGVSSEVAVDGKPLGVDALRFAVMQAAGLELGKKPKRVTGNVVRVIEGSVVRPVKVDLK